jgi:replication-associated recombination protein RarA
MSKESLINKYRPKTFKQIIGQNAVVASFKSALDERTSHAFIFTGPAGTGKTSLARIGAAYAGTDRSGLREISAAVYNGVDNMRELEELVAYRPLTGSTKSFIIDECQQISKAGWDALLKILEEPPSWMNWFFCTTNFNRLPETIKQRCTTYILKQVPFSELFDFLCDIVEREKCNTPRQIIELCAKNSLGSPRKALINLSACRDARDRAEALELIINTEVVEAGPEFNLARALAQRFKWNKIQPLLLKLSEDENINPETVRHTVRAYFTKMALGTERELPDEKTVCFALSILDNFLEPFDSTNGISPVVAAVGRCLFSGTYS